MLTTTAPFNMLTKDQENKGYRVELKGGYVLVWQNKHQIGLLLKTTDISQKVRSLVEKHLLQGEEGKKET